MILLYGAGGEPGRGEIPMDSTRNRASDEFLSCTYKRILAGGEADGSADLEKVEDGYVYTIEGNTSDSCAERWYPIDYYEILGYGVPAY